MKQFLDTVGNVKKLYSLNPVCWAVTTTQNELDKFLNLQNLGPNFAGAKFTTKKLPTLSANERTRKRRQNKKNSKSKKARLTAEEVGQPGCSKDLENELWAQIGDWKNKATNLQADLSEEKIKVREEKLKKTVAVKILEAKVRKATGNEVDYEAHEREIVQM